MCLTRASYKTYGSLFTEHAVQMRCMSDDHSMAVSSALKLSGGAGRAGTGIRARRLDGRSAQAADRRGGGVRCLIVFFLSFLFLPSGICSTRQGHCKAVGYCNLRGGRVLVWLKPSASWATAAQPSPGLLRPGQHPGTWLTPSVGLALEEQTNEPASPGHCHAPLRLTPPSVLRSISGQCPVNIRSIVLRCAVR